MKKVIIIIASLMLIAGIGFLLFEPVSTSVNNYTANKIADEFDEIVKNANKKDKKNNHNKSVAKTSDSDSGGKITAPTKEQLDRLLKASKKYNENIFSNQGTVSTSDYSRAAINLNKYGIYNNLYGYVSAPAINMRLPIYLGANDSMLSYGAAHLCNTSLPINGKNVNCALAGHSGYTGRELFNNVKNLKVGNNVSVKNYWGTINYRVIKTHIVAPEYTNDIVIRPKKQLLTLITCVSAGGDKFNRFIAVCEKV
ncbi:MAG: sortase [Ruminococcus sp.]|nr:sortase [Ruminococcus sp.]